MKIQNLVENEQGKNGCLAEHGLSVYLETGKHKLLVDTGATDAFLRNAEFLGIDLKEVDILILSHGHYDHGGGILAFSKINPRARIYIREDAFAKYYHERERGTDYIGLDPEIRGLPQVVVVGGDLRLDEELYLFTNVAGRRMWPEGNRELRVRKDGALVQDDFRHEQYLIVNCGGKEILLSGCAHNGILNILDRYREIRERYPDFVISGFHMMKDGEYTEEDKKLIRQTARELQKMPTRFVTGHCTGIPAYKMLKEILGEQIRYLGSGEELDLSAWM